MARPRPVPPKRRLIETSAWVNFWNSVGCASSIDTDAGIDDLETHDRVIAERARHGDVDVDMAAIGEFDGVAGDVEQHLAQPHRVAAEPAASGGTDRHAEPHIFLRRARAEG